MKIDYTLLPLSYFIITRIRNLKDAIIYGYIHFVVILIGFRYLNVPVNIYLLLLSWVSLMQLYEIGYFVNDRYAVVNEANPTLRENYNFKRFGLISFVALRLLFFSILFSLFQMLYPPYLLGFTLVCLSVAVMMVLHNLFKGILRSVTFGFLYFLKLNIVTFSLAGEKIFDYLLCVSPFILFLSLNYSMKLLKKTARSRILQKLVIMLFVLPTIILLFFKPIALVFIIGYLLLTWLMRTIMALLALRAELLNGLSMVHLHSKYSFDSELEIEEVDCFLKKSHYREVYLTEHATDYDNHKFIDYVAYLNKYSKEKVYYPGLEYSIFGNHVLCLNQKSFIHQNKIKSPTNVAQLRAVAAKIILAHPGRPLLKMIRSPFKLINFIKAVDAVELINLRPKRKLVSHLVTFILAIIIGTLFNKELTLGIDAHQKQDLELALNKLDNMRKYIYR